MWIGWVGSAGALELVDGPARWVDDWDVPVGVAPLHFDDGFVFPVVSGDGVPAGFVFVGTGRTAIPLTRSSEALSLAEALTVAGVDAASAVSVYRQRTLHEGFDVALVLTRDPSLNRDVAALPALTDDKNVALTDAQGRDHLIVTDHRQRPAARRAQEVLRERGRRLADAGLDPNVLIAQDALRPADATRLLAEVHTAHSWLPMREPSIASLSDHWLTFSRDPTGAVDDAHTNTVLVHGLAPGERVTHRVLTGNGALPDRGATITAGAVNGVVREGIGISHAVRFEALLDVSRTEDERLLPLAIPLGTERFMKEGVVTVLGGFEVEEVATVDGIPLERLGGHYGWLVPDGRWKVATYSLPANAAPDIPVRIRVVWTDRWPAARPVEVKPWALDLSDRCGYRAQCPDVALGSPNLPDFIELGRVAAHKAVVPIIPHRRPAPVTIRLGTTLSDRWQATVGTDRGAVTDAADGRWWVAKTTTAARVSFGQFTEHVSSAVGTYPGVRVLEHRPTGGGSPAFVRSVVHFYRSALPPFPHAQFAVVQGPDIPTIGRLADDVTAHQLRDTPLAVSNVPREVPTDLLLAVAPAQAVLFGFTEVGDSGSNSYERQRASTFPHEVERHMAQALATQWTARGDLRHGDAWIAPATAVYLRDRFVEEAFGPEVAKTWDRARNDALIDQVGRARVVPLAGGTEPWLGEIGGQRLAALATRIGEPALLEGLSAYLAGPDPSVDALVAAISKAARMDVGPFFDAWFLSGVRPTVTGTYHIDKDNILVVKLASDLPAAQMPVPIGVTTRRGTTLSWVDLTDGKAEARILMRGPLLGVAVDPDQRLPLRSSVRPE